MELDRRGVLSGGADVLGHRDLAAIDVVAERLELVGDLGGRDGAEDAVVLAGLDRDQDLRALDLRGLLLSVATCGLDLVSRLTALLLVPLTHRLRSDDGELVWDEVVLAEARLDVDNVALHAERVVVLRKNDCHWFGVVEWNGLVGLEDVCVRPRGRGVALLDVVGDEREQRHVAGPLDGGRELTLELGGDAGHAPREQLAGLVHEPLERLSVLVIDVCDAGFLEGALHGGSLRTRRCDPLKVLRVGGGQEARGDLGRDGARRRLGADLRGGLLDSRGRVGGGGDGGGLEGVAHAGLLDLCHLGVLGAGGGGGLCGRRLCNGGPRDRSYGYRGLGGVGVLDFCHGSVGL